MLFFVAILERLCLDRSKTCAAIAVYDTCLNNGTSLQTICPFSCGRCGSSKFNIYNYNDLFCHCLNFD